MKTSVELNGYIVSIEEENGVISVTATKDEEVVEEFTIQTEEGEDLEGSEEEGEDVRSFGDYDEEEDFEGSEEEGEEDDDDFEGSEEDDDDDDFEDEMVKGKGNEAALESFQSFISKKK
jgi:hypothetical protein